MCQGSGVNIKNVEYVIGGNYYRKFLPDFAKMTAGLNAVKSKIIDKLLEFVDHFLQEYELF